MRAGCVLLIASLTCFASALIPFSSLPRSLSTTHVSRDSLTSLDACRRNTKKEKRQRNYENMRKFKRGNAPVARGGGGKKKTLSRKKLTLKAQAAKEKERESAFTARLFVVTGAMEEKKLDLGVL